MTAFPFADAVEKFVSYYVDNRNRSKRTIEIYRLALGRLAEFLLSIERDWQQVTHDDLLLFTGMFLYRKGLKDPLSRRTHVAATRNFYRWAASRGLVGNSPAETIPYPHAGRKLPRVLTLANAEKLMWAPDFSTFLGVRDAAMMSLLIGCGLRVSGLVHLNQSNLLREEIDRRPRLVLNVTEKGNKQRRLPVPEQAALLVGIYLEHPELKAIDRTLPNGDQVLFVSTNSFHVPPHEYHGENRRLRRGSVVDVIKKYGRAEKIPEEQLHPHALRHLYGTELREDDVDLITRQRLMGHEDPKTTAIYDHLAMRKVTRDVDRANPLAKIRSPASDLLQKLQQPKP